MKLFQRIFFAAVLAGLAAGIAMSAFQQWRVVPLILAAETYETAEPAADHDAMAATAESAESTAAATPMEHGEAEVWAPQDGVERVSYTILANLLGSIGFALLIAAASVLAGMPITASNGVLWGLGGLVVFHIAPALGLAPGLPGMPVIPTAPRQFWWLLTAASSGAGLLLIAKLRNGFAVAVAAALLLAPHLIGAPSPSTEASAVPPRLALEFAYASVASSALFWLTVGPLLGYLVELFARREAAQLKGALA